MDKWIVCTTAHEAYEFDSEAKALEFKQKTEGIYKAVAPPSTLPCTPGTTPLS